MRESIKDDVHGNFNKYIYGKLSVGDKRIGTTIDIYKCDENDGYLCHEKVVGGDGNQLGREGGWWYNINSKYFYIIYYNQF